MTNPNTLANIHAIINNKADAQPIIANVLTDDGITDVVNDSKINKGHVRALYEYLLAMYNRGIIDPGTVLRIGYKHVNKGSDVIACHADRFHMQYDNKNAYSILNDETGVIRRGTLTWCDFGTM